MKGKKEMTKTLTIQSVAKEMSDNLVWSKRDNGDDYCHMKEDIDWQRDIIFKAHLDRMPDDDIYDRIDTILSNWAELDEDATEDDFYDRLYEIEPDCYTSTLTKWLHSDNRNVYYLDEAISMGCTEGFQLLACAQKAYIEEIGRELLSGIQDYVEENDEV